MGAPMLATDGYKFSMAEAGWPLRKETFYSSHRKGGLQVLPFDVEAELKKLTPQVGEGDWAWLASHEYDMGSAFRAAITSGALQVHALPKLSVFHDREPIFSVTGPSALVSWLEPLVLMWNYRIQVATAALLRPETLDTVLTCEAQKALVLETLDAVGVHAPRTFRVEPEAYVARVQAQAQRLADITGSGGRIFEVGLRAATCLEQHLLALQGCKAAGVLRTSDAWGARQLGLTPVGTMGHEHIQRYGSDEAAFRAMVERRHQRSSFLLDTFDTITSGLPTAYTVMAERPSARDSIRYDSGDKEVQYRHAVKLARERGLEPVHILEDGFDDVQTQRFEVLRAELGVRAEDQLYGFGGYLVAQTSGSKMTRDRVAAVYKLSQTGARPTMKFGNETGAGKQSLPGRPVLFRRQPGAKGPFGVVGQLGESPPPGYALLTGASSGTGVALGEARAVAAEDLTLALSAQTQAMVDALRAQAFGGRA